MKSETAKRHMASRRSDILVILALFCILPQQIRAQVVDSVIVYRGESYTSRSDFDPKYHFNDSEIRSQQKKPLRKNFSDSLWNAEMKGKDFREDTLEKKAEEPKEFKPIKTRTNFSFLKEFWIIPALLILIFLIYKLIPLYKTRNIRNKREIVMNFDSLEEDEIRMLEVETLLDKALREGDYRLAYRLRYLDVLKKLIEKNLLLYRKEKTNYEYLNELRSSSVFESFRLLTFNFDGIWYGELEIDKDRYNGLNTYFDTFYEAIRNAD